MGLYLQWMNIKAPRTEDTIWKHSVLRNGVHLALLFIIDPILGDTWLSQGVNQICSYGLSALRVNAFGCTGLDSVVI